MEISNACKLPCVVQVGFAGSRDLFPGAADPRALYGDVETYLLKCFEQIRADLELGNHHFFCGISQVAIGSDMAFGRACSKAGIPQRVFLAQSRDQYLDAVNSENVPDFSETQKADARAILNSPHAIQERVVSDSLNRRERFRDTIMETLRVSDFVVCLMPAETQSKSGRGGTNDTLANAILRGKPALEVRVGESGGTATFTETWHNRGKFQRPEPPADFAAVECPTSPLPESATFLATLKDFTGPHAKKRKRLFSYLVLAIIGLHVLATIFATGALAIHGLLPEGETLQFALMAFLGLELACLYGGVLIHRRFHHSSPARVWAVSRLVTEIIESVVQIHSYPLYLGHLFMLPFPHQLRPLLRTINVLHLRSTRGKPATEWETVRNDYVDHRLKDAKRGQLKYYEKEIGRVTKWLKRAKTAFWYFAILAILSTMVELGFVVLDRWIDSKELHLSMPVLGLFAVLFPILAVAVMSWSIAMSYEARLHTYRETHLFLSGQHLVNLEQAQTKSEFEKLLVETESRLLGENLNWYYRQSFADVG